MQRGIVRIMTVALVVSACAFAASRADQAPEIKSLQEQVRAAETAFAKTMADRDHAAFAAFIADEAIFYGRDGEIRGKQAVVESWKGLFEGKDAPFSWRPENVSVLDSGTGPELGARVQSGGEADGDVPVDLAAHARRPLGDHLRQGLSVLPGEVATRRARAR
jgi:ketosteroid isomerase-like protein